MARDQLHDSAALNFWFMSGQFGTARLLESTLYILDPDSHISQYIESSVPGTAVRLPLLSEGKFFIITNTGAEDLDIQSSTGASLFTLKAGSSNLYHTEGATWRKLVANDFTIGVFTETEDGLVPAPGAPIGDLRFLDEEGNWTTPDGGGGGLSNAYANITDGTNTAVASGSDTFRIRSSSGKITAVVTNNEAVFGDNVNLSVSEAAIDHDALLNFVANEHIDHSGVTFTAGNGLAGGGTIEANRTFDLDLNDLGVAAAIVLTDTFGFYDISAVATVKTTFTALNGILDHDSLLNFVANEHIDHSAVSISTGTGLTGGGDITASRTINLDFSALPVQAEAMASGDTFPFFDLSGGIHKKVSWNTINTSLDHDALFNFVGNEHIDHTAVTLTAGAGLTGGGDISASRSFVVGAGTGITVNADDVAISADGVTNTLLANMAAWSFKIRNAGTLGDPSDAALADFTTEGTPAAGMFLTGFLSTGEIRKFDIGDLPGGGGGINNVVEDLTPQLGGDLDANGFDILFDDGDGIHSSTDEPLVTFSSAGGGAASATVHATDTTFPDGWANNLKLVAIDYPALWFHATNPDLGIVYAFDSLTNIFWMGEVAAGVPDDVLKWDFDNDSFFPEMASWDLGTPTKPWDVGYFTSFELGHASDTTITRGAAGIMQVEGSNVLTEATAEAFVEAAIDTLPNLISIQGHTVTLADAGANAFFGWDDVAGAYENLTAAEAEAIIEPLIDTLANLTSIQGVTFTFGAYAATLLNNANEAAFKAAVNLEIGVDVQAFDELLNEIAALSTDPNADSGLFFDDSAGNVAYWTPTNGLEFSGTNLRITDNSRIATLTFVIDGGGSAITTGIKGDLEVPFACTITRATALADQTGSIVVDIWKDTYANYPPVDADSITASAPVTISSTNKAQDATLTGWNTAIAAGDTLRFNVDSITTLTRVTISLRVTRT